LTPRKKKLSYEQGMERLGAIAEQLRGGGLTLEASMKLYEEGMELSAQLDAMLTEYQKRIEMIDPETAEITAFEENSDDIS